MLDLLGALKQVEHMGLRTPIRMRRAAGAVAGAMLLGAAAPAPPDPPEALKPYVQNGRFEPGDYAWARGVFPGASREDSAATEQLGRWTLDCSEHGKAWTVSELRALGIANPQVDRFGPRDPLCLQVMASLPSPTTSFADFQQAAAEARPVFQAFVFAIDVAVAHTQGSSLERQLRARTLAEQMLREASPWGVGKASGAPRLSAKAEEILNRLIGGEMNRRDHSNTEWLKQQVDRTGWPKRSEQGDEIAASYWLITQHADNDPAFQLRMLRLMEPLAKVGEVDKSQFALLTDRVLLKTSGKQRYGTQTHCENNKWQPQPIEDESKLDELRAQAGLPPMADYLKVISEMFGPCTSNS